MRGPIAILGGRGMLGTDLAAQCAKSGLATAVFDLPEFDITKADNIRRAIDGASAVVNCAAYTNVEKAEAEPELAAKINADAVGRLGEAARQAGITGKTAILAGIFPLESVEEAETLAKKYTEFQIPAPVVERLKAAGDLEAQKKEGLAICVETIDKLKSMNGLRGIHLLSGGKEEMLPAILSASGWSGKR